MRKTRTRNEKFASLSEKGRKTPTAFWVSLKLTDRVIKLFERLIWFACCLDHLANIALQDKIIKDPLDSTEA